MRICLNMIVKNEAARIVRALQSAMPYIDCYVITDTGSTDDTKQVIAEYFAVHKIPGEITDAPFIDWSQARNSALIAARARQSRFEWDYALLMDADMELVVDDEAKFYEHMRGGMSYDMEQRTHSLHYLNRRLVSKDATGIYRGVTHEYLDVASAGEVPAAVAYFKDHADGANRPDKFQRDIRLLLKGLEDEPDNSRYFYYLAQSYRDGGDLDNAMKWYKKRVEAGGWIEEQWSAQVNYAHCFKDKGDEANFIREMLIAYNMRPSRAESLYDLAHYFRLQDGKQHISALFAEVGMTIPRSTDALFVSDYVYKGGLAEEFAITAFYNEQKRAKGFEVCNHLSVAPGPYPTTRNTGRQNIYWYLPSLGKVAPSFRSQKIPFVPPENWIALNPSVALHDGRAYCIVRTVNYRINEHGQYLIRANDGTANATNPIHTRNWLVELDDDPMTTKAYATEITEGPYALPLEFPPVIGYEDMRLFSWKGYLMFSACVRQAHWDGNCEQVVGHIRRKVGGTFVEGWRRMLREPRETEKNWAPILHNGEDMLWMWRPGTTINERGVFMHNNPPPITTDIISGGSQVVPFGPGYVALVHTANALPGSVCRYYYHRFAFYTPDFKLAVMSKPFVFEDKVIEFAAGMCKHPTQDGTYVISYGSRDAEARIATISEVDIGRLLWPALKS